MKRRNFLLGAAATSTLVATNVLGIGTAQAVASPRRLEGANLTGWETVVGDGLLVKPGQAPVSLSDIGTRHFSDHSKLQANVLERDVMAHNITFKRQIDDQALDFRHKASFQFRLPEVPRTTNLHWNAQTFEGGFFIWDGSGDRRDHGLAFQWVLNPWSPEYGMVQKWHQSNRGWKPVTFVQPDTQWHTVKIELDPRSRFAELCLDDVCIDRVYTRRVKPESWGSETAARLQAEIISLDPGPNQSAPAHTAEVRNWTWDWEL